MNQAVLTTIAISGFVVAFFHAAIPTHWLPFVLTARVQRWSSGRTIAITGLAGTGHVIVTALLGLAVALIGAKVSDTIGTWFPRVAGGVLIAFGCYYLVRQVRGHGHVHFHYPHEHLHEHSDAHQPHRTSDRTAILSLLTFLTLSPCEGFVPFYVSGIRFGWLGFGFLTAVLSVATVGGMICFTSLTLAGVSRIKLAFLERYESVIMGLLLCAVGALIIVFET
ncbi:MAG: hypothetical protein ACJ8JD_00555 [Chthoniobacterales bacterium]